MQFLRKYQKILFLVIAIMTVGSFAVSGNFSGAASAAEEKKIGKTLDGTAIYDRDLKALTHFISLGSNDVLRSDLIDSGAFSLLAEKYFAEIQGDFQEKLQKAKAAVFYSHPQAPFINAVEVWNRYYPPLVQHYQELLSGSLNAKTFSTYAKLYVDQQVFSPELLRTILMYQQHDYKGLPPDYKLNDIRAVSLFGYQTFEEWFGPRFSDILGKFILNTAALAEKKGYKVSLKEARTDFLFMCRDAAKSKKKELSSQEATEYRVMQLQLAGVDESRAVQLWRKTMLVHRYFQDMQQLVLLDPIPYEQFAAFADSKASVEVYQLPQALRLKDFQSMLKVQYYLEAVSPKGKNSFSDLPRQFYSAEEVEKKHPQLVTSRYELEVAKVSHDVVSSRLGLKALWDFETSDAGWSALTAEFPVLNKKDSLSAIDREKILDSCDPELRQKVDRLACRTIVKAHPEWAAEALQAQPFEKVALPIRSKGALAPFDDIEETFHLRQALQNAEIGETIQFTSPKELTYYQIKVLQKPEKKEVMTLNEAMENDLLGTLLDEKLESALTDARKKDNAIYKASDGSWRPYSEVKDYVGAYVYADLLKALSGEPLSFDEYASKRFEKVMEQAKISIQKEQDASHFLTTSGQALLDQWTLSKRHQVIRRSDTTQLPKTEMFSKAVGSWSSVAVPQGGNVSFFYLLERDASDLKIDEQVRTGQQLIGKDVMCQRIGALLDEVGLL
jgi:hypothetical protein